MITSDSAARRRRPLHLPASLVLCLVLFTTLGATAGTSSAAQIATIFPSQLAARATGTPGECAVTPYADWGLTDPFTSTWYHNGQLAAGPDRAYYGQWFAGSDGMKVQWRVPIVRELTVVGHRLDGSAPPLEFSTPPGGYLGGFTPSMMVFPTEGCWEVTGRIPTQELRFVVYVHPATEAPIKAGRSTQVPPSASDWAHLRRPLHLPAVASGDRCPISATQQSDRTKAALIGGEPISLGLPNNGGGVGTVAFDPHLGTPGWAMHTELWASDPSYAGPVLIRGRRIDGQGALRVDKGISELQLAKGESEATPDWRFWRTSMEAPSPGCYAAQVDGQGSSQVIVFKVGPEPANAS